MAVYRIDKKDYVKVKGKGKEVVKKNKFESFNEDILGLGKIDKKSNQINALSAIFDLEGFTNFCKQIDPHLAVPEYLNDFLKWIFKEIRVEFIQDEYNEGYEMWSDLPFLSKYLGDGILFLWDTDSMDDTEILNVVVSLYEVCEKYTTDFLPEISDKIISPPTKLRCGIARGAIYSVGNGNDYVGACINMSARLQKLHSLSFCFSRRGLDPLKMEEGYKSIFITKKVNIRGIGENELVCFRKDEYNNLSVDLKNLFV